MKYFRKLGKNFFTITIIIIMYNILNKVVKLCNLCITNTNNNNNHLRQIIPFKDNLI